jgi:predicted RNA binding protein YcfA (HicA-like mRNA interferase family)
MVMLHHAASTPCRYVRLTSNVRPRKTSLGVPASNTNWPTPPTGASVYAAGMKVAEVLRLLQQDGWVLVAQRGSHRQFKHGSKAGRVTVPGKPSDDLAPGTQNSILKQAGLK